MRKSLNLALSGALLGAMTATAIPTEALAGPMGVAPPSAVGLSAPVDKVWYRRWGGGYGYRGYGYRGGYYGGYRRGNPGAAIAAGVGLGLLGAGLAASSGGYYGGYYPYYNGGYYPSYGYGGYGYGYPAYGGGWGW